MLNAFPSWFDFFFSFFVIPLSHISRIFTYLFIHALRINTIPPMVEKIFEEMSRPAASHIYLMLRLW